MCTLPTRHPIPAPHAPIAGRRRFRTIQKPHHLAQEAHEHLVIARNRQPRHRAAQLGRAVLCLNVARRLKDDQPQRGYRSQGKALPRRPFQRQRVGVQLPAVERRVLGLGRRRLEVDHTIGSIVQRHGRVKAPTDVARRCASRHSERLRVHPALAVANDAGRHGRRDPFRAHAVVVRRHARVDGAEDAGKRHAGPAEVARDLEIEAARALVPEEGQVGGAEFVLRHSRTTVVVGANRACRELEIERSSHHMASQLRRRSHIEGQIGALCSVLFHEPAMALSSIISISSERIPPLSSSWVMIRAPRTPPPWSAGRMSWARYHSSLSFQRRR